MGMLFTTEGTRRIVDALNTAFSEAGVNQIRSDEAAKPWLTDLNRKWKLARACFIYSIYPVSLDPDNNPGQVLQKHKHRWHFFLKNHLFAKFQMQHDQIETVGFHYFARGCEDRKLSFENADGQAREIRKQPTSRSPNKMQRAFDLS